MKKFTVLFFVLISFFAGAKDYNIRRLSVEQGLSNNNIVNIIEDRKGFIWISTKSGLNRFDGNHFKVFKHSPFIPNTIATDVLNPIFISKNADEIWIATERNGMNSYNFSTHQFNYYGHNYNSENPSSIAADGITDIKDDENGNLWIATYQKGFDFFNKNTKEFIHFNQSNIKNLVTDYNWTILDDRQGHLYIGHVLNGLSIVDIKKRTAVNFSHDPSNPESIPDNSVYCIFIDSKKNVWLGTGNGLALFNPSTEKFRVFRKLDNKANSLSNNNIKCITETSDNKLWIGTVGGGINIFDFNDQLFNNPDEVRFDHIPVSSGPNGIPNGSITSIMQDTFGNIWIGTLGGGLYFIANKENFFNTISYLPIPGNQNTISNNSVNCMLFNNSGNLIVGTNGSGVDILSDNKFIGNLNSNNSMLNSNNISGLYKLKNGNILLGTETGKIYILNPENSQLKPFRNIIPENIQIKFFLQDLDDNILAGTNRGLYVQKKDGSVKNIFVNNSGVTDNVHRSIIQDQNGNYWVGTLGGGLDILDKNFKMLRFYGNYDGFYGISQIFQDSKKRIWVGRRENLVMFQSCNDSAFVQYGLNEGLTENNIKAIAEGTTADDIWISTTSGISNLNVATGKITNYTQADGIPYGDYVSAAVTKSKNGIIYFGSQNGICYFNPAVSQQNSALPAVEISEISIISDENTHTGEPADIPIQNNISFKYDESTIRIAYNILDYSLSSKVEFSYMMKGLSDNWYNVHNEKQLTFRNLRPGNYTFQIRARLRNQDWSKEFTSFDFTIDPPFWFSWWAKTIYFVLIVLVSLYIIRFYKRKLNLENSLYLEKQNHLQEQSLNNERLRFYTNITHELRTPLTLIIGPIEDLISDKSLQPGHLKKINSIHRSAVRLLELINQLLEFRKSETSNRKLSVIKGNIADLIHETGLKFEELNQNKDVQINVTLPDESPEIYFDPEVITIILDNLLSNALKYTYTGEISLKLAFTTIEGIRYCKIIVSDTGIGIPEEELNHIFDRYYQVKSHKKVSGTGIGLSLVKNLIELHEGTITVESKVNAGTTFNIILLVNNSYPDALHAEPKNARLPEQEIINTFTKQMILIVEDNIEIRDYISECFTDSFEILVAEDGLQGLNLCLEKIPDIVITDIMMPVMDGIEMCKKIKEDIRTSHIPVIMLTAKDSIQDKTEGYDTGADSYITKPFSGNLLRSRVNNLLESRKKIAEMLSSQTAMKHSIVKEAISKLDNDFIEKLTKIIEENLETEQLNIAQIADQLYMSHSTLYRKIKALTGLSANEFIRKIRIYNAEKLLLTGKYNINEIIFKVGISSPAYFRQCFKEEFGVTPTEYLQKIKNGK
ncbi:MAG: two-component regulator propeller domain-containing protein [Paludibacter sp.]|nr:two-component regulator propeller domain-containing protein [Paludibacter sp.]